MLASVNSHINGSRITVSAALCRLLKKPVRFRFRGSRYVVNPDRSAAYHIRHSTEKLARMVDLIGSEPAVAVDIGANCGLFSAFLSKRYPSCKIFAFEPAPIFPDIIRANCPSSNIEIYSCALGGNDENATFYINARSQQTNSLNRMAAVAFSQDSEPDEMEVKCRRLDGFLLERSIHKVDVMKIDVQGAEAAVFEGAQETLSKVDYLFLESSWMDIDSITQVIPLARQFGFSHLAVVNSVHMGADLLLSRAPVTGHDRIAFHYVITPSGAIPAHS